MARGATEEAHDGRTDEVIAAIQKTGKAFFAGTTLAQQLSATGKRLMMMSSGESGSQRSQSLNPEL